MHEEGARGGCTRRVHEEGARGECSRRVLVLSGALERLPGGSKLSLSLSKAWALPVFATMLTIAGPALQAPLAAPATA